VIGGWKRVAPSRLPKKLGRGVSQHELLIAVDSPALNAIQSAGLFLSLIPQAFVIIFLRHRLTCSKDLVFDHGGEQYRDFSQGEFVKISS
jgi:hypothetical protein